MCLRRLKLPALGCKQSNLSAHRGGRDEKGSYHRLILTLQSTVVTPPLEGVEHSCSRPKTVFIKHVSGYTVVIPL